MSIAQVSRIAGVSTSTVSRVLNNHPHVSPRTADQVRQVMRELNYRPRRYGDVRGQAHDASARRLAVFALIVPEMRNGFYPTLIDSFTRGAEAMHHQVLACCTDNDVDRQANAILQLMDHSVAGVAMVPATTGDWPARHVRQLQAHGIPVVFMHRAIPDVAAPLLAIDFDAAGCLAATQLIEAGHRRVAMFGTHRTHDPNQYLRGLRSVLNRHGCDIPAELIHYGSSSKPITAVDCEKDVEEALRRMLALPAASRPTAIFCSFDPYAEAVYLALDKLGVSVPREISLVSIGGMDRQGAIAQRIAAVTVDEAWAGREATRLLEEIAADRREAREEYRQDIPLRWYPGATLAPPARLRAAWE